MAAAEYAALGIIAGYLLWYHWFVVRAGLVLTALQAVLIPRHIGSMLLILIRI